jgi:hypothetical protein
MFSKKAKIYVAFLENMNFNDSVVFEIDNKWVCTKLRLFQDFPFQNKYFIKNETAICELFRYFVFVVEGRRKVWKSGSASSNLPLL